MSYASAYVLRLSPVPTEECATRKRPCRARQGLLLLCRLPRHSHHCHSHCHPPSPAQHTCIPLPPHQHPHPPLPSQLRLIIVLLPQRPVSRRLWALASFLGPDPGQVDLAQVGPDPVQVTAAAGRRRSPALARLGRIVPTPQALGPSLAQQKAETVERWPCGAMAVAVIDA